MEEVQFPLAVNDGGPEFTDGIRIGFLETGFAGQGHPGVGVARVRFQQIAAHKR
jgi:hypothetical protein